MLTCDEIRERLAKIEREVKEEIDTFGDPKDHASLPKYDQGQLDILKWVWEDLLGNSP